MAFCTKTGWVIRQCISFYKPLKISEIPSRNIHRWVAPTLKELYRRKQRLEPEPEQPRSRYLEWNYDAELFAFGKRLGEELDRSLLKQALVQREYANIQEVKAQRKGTVSEELKHNYELVQEGEDIINDYLKTELNKTYQKDIVDAVLRYLTEEEMLANIGSHLGLKDLILTDEYPPTSKTLSDTFKAVVAALKRSQDLARAENFIKDFVLVQLNGKNVYDIWNLKDPYEYLTRLLKEKGITDIEPRLCAVSASNTIMSCYQVGLYSDKKLLGIGWGENTKIAQETAAVDAIRRLHSKHVNKD